MQSRTSVHCIQTVRVQLSTLDLALIQPLLGCSGGSKQADTADCGALYRGGSRVYLVDAQFGGKVFR